jgi:hypothetical protein
MSDGLSESAAGEGAAEAAVPRRIPWPPSDGAVCHAKVADCCLAAGSAGISFPAGREDLLTGLEAHDA